MIEIEDALERILNEVSVAPAENVALATSTYRVLAEEVVSDVDDPPFDRAMMDGFAVRSADVTAEGVTLDIAGTITAGNNHRPSLVEGQTYRIMTGSMVPEGADAVVMRELTDDPAEDQDPQRVEIRKFPVAAGENVLPQAANLKTDQVVLTAGTVIRAAEMGVLAQVGKMKPLVHRCPQVGVLATGDELVRVSQNPSTGQIRNTNGPMLTSLARSYLTNCTNLGIIKDTETDLLKALQAGTQRRFFVCCGGVSAGDRDLLPRVFKDNGVEEIFHRVNLKPGKPMWFGKAPKGTLIFGLPGNPVSSLVCFYLFVRPALVKASGRPWNGYGFRPATLEHDHQITGQRRALMPAKKTLHEDGNVSVEVVSSSGSADLLAMTRADCLVEFPTPGQYASGTEVRWLELNSFQP